MVSGLVIYIPAGVRLSAFDVPSSCEVRLDDIRPRIHTIDSQSESFRLREFPQASRLSPPKE
jgi:hypothetical protein